MEKVSFIEITEPISGEVSTHAIIDRGNGEFTSMPRVVYEAQLAAQVEHLTEIPTPDEA